MAGQINDMKTLLEYYSRYKAPGLETKRTAQPAILPLIAALPKGLFTTEQLGKSFEGRAIYGIRVGEGKTRVLAWSQMHGDESTATRSLFDLFRFLTADDEWNAIRNDILQHAQGIDMNRDARSTATPEAQLLQRLCRDFQPHFALNLHDQNSYYSAGVSHYPATFSFLAAPPDADDSMYPTRRQAMQLIVHVVKKLQPLLPHNIGRWSNDYEPRAFGEWFQSQKAATILVESGGFPDDEERLKVRHFHFGIIIELLHGIATAAYAEEDIAPYYSLPLNRENGLFDRIERNTEVTVGGKTFLTDVGYRENEVVRGDLRDYGSYK